MAYSTIVKPSVYFNTKLYTGNGGTNAITGVGFQPDWVWLKKRSGTASHNVFDAVRGVTKTIYTNSSEAEYTEATALTAFGTDGFTLGAYGDTNSNSATFASWNWKANGQGSSNTDGSINTISTSVNTTAGFSISRYTGTGANATIGHGLGAVPQVVIARNITDAEQWTTYHVGLDATAPQNYHVRLNTTDARVDEASVWNDTAPTSSVFSVGSSGAPNGSGDNHIAYCFAEKTGYSKFGSYTGNGNANGTFVYTGFKPAFLIYKKAIQTGNAGRWSIIDNKRDPSNVASHGLAANASSAENTGAQYWDVDLLSNGFKFRTTEHETNGNGETFIFMAFAEEPLVANSGNDGVPATAR